MRQHLKMDLRFYDDLTAANEYIMMYKAEIWRYHQELYN